MQVQEPMNASASDRAGVSHGTVVLLHGFAGLSVMSRPQARMLRRAGFETREVGYDSWGKSLSQICDRLVPRVARIAEKSDGPVHFVGHSMGGLVIRALLSVWRPAHLGHVVMLGTPNAGSEIADFVDSWTLLRPILGQAGAALVTRRGASVEALLGPIDYSLGIIAGDWHMPGTPFSRLFPGAHDGKVSIASTWLPDAADHIVLSLPHTMLLYHPLALRAVRHFLIHGRFAADARRDYR